MIRRRLVLLALLAGLSLGLVKADDWFLLHTARKGETLASIAKNYYGESWKEIYIRLANRQLPGAKVAPDSQLRIPTVVEHTVQTNDTYAKLAGNYFKRADLASLLIWANSQYKGEFPKSGSVIRIPHILRFAVKPTDTLESIAQQVYQDRHMAVVIKNWNKLSKISPNAPLGNTKIIWFALREGVRAPTSPRPTSDQVESVGSTPSAATQDPTPQPTPEGDSVATFDSGAMSLVKELIRAGKFAESLALLKKMPLPRANNIAQLADYHWQLIICRVALGEEKPALEAIKAYLATGLESKQSLLDKKDQHSPKITRLIEQL